MAKKSKKSPGEVAEPLQTPTKAEDKANRAAMNKAPRSAKKPGIKALPTMDDVEVAPGGCEERVIDPPIRVLAGPNRAMLEVVGMEKAELAPGKREGVKAPGQTRYLVRAEGDEAGNVGTLLADDLVVLDKE